MKSIKKDHFPQPGKTLNRPERYLKYPVAVLLLLSLASCDPKVMFDDTKPLKENVWKQDQVIDFTVTVNDTINIYKFYLNVRHSTHYGYANLFLFINTTFPDGRSARDTVECILADKSGKWLGRGITNIRDNQVLLRRGLRFPTAGEYRFEIEQAMREEKLEGIADIGLRIEKE